MALIMTSLEITGLLLANIILLLMVGIMIHLTNVTFKFSKVMDGAIDEISDMKKEAK